MNDVDERLSRIKRLGAKLPPLAAASTPAPHQEGAAGRVRRSLGKCLVVLGTLIVCLVILEVSLRLSGRYPMGNLEGYFERGGLSYGLKRNLTKQVLWPTMSFTVHTSDLGFRSPKPGPQPIGHHPYCAVLGASDVFGNGLDYEKTFVGVYAGKMAYHGMDVLNMGVAGHHLREQSALFKQYASSAAQAPKEVIIVLNPLLIGGFDDINTNVVVRRGDLFEKDNWRLPLLRKALANLSTSYCFLRDGIRNVQHRYLHRKDFAMSFWTTRYSTRHRIRAPGKTEEFLKELKDLEEFIRRLNARPVCVYSPPVGEFLLAELEAKGGIEPGSVDTRFFLELVQTHCQSEGIQFVNFKPLLQEMYNKNQKLNFDGDAHFNEATSRRVGEFLYEELRPDRRAEPR
jgi:hypothetical protein